MDVSTWIAIGIAAGSMAIAGISAWIAFKAVRESKRLQEKQWRRDELELRRDVLRRLFAYRYRLTEALKGGDGEPFIALNEAWVVYAGFPDVTNALTKMHNELGKQGCLSHNIAVLIRAMSDAADLSIRDLDDRLITQPFTPPASRRTP